MKRLSSGLRINSAGDDPSGLAIAESLQSRVNGLQSGEIDLKTANNALTVAEGALSTVASILQRMRSLVVQSNTDINSPSDLQALQTEIDQLKLEINRIGENTTFNGRPLLDGSLSAQPPKPVRVVPMAAQTPNIPGSLGLSNSNVNTVDPTGAFGPNGPGPLLKNVTMAPGTPTTFFQISITGFDQNAIDPVVGPVGPGIYVRTQAYSDEPQWGPQVDITNALPVAGGPPPGTGYLAGNIQTNNSGNFQIQFDLSNVTAADVGAAMAFILYTNQPAATGQPAQINVGRHEGDRVTAEVPGISTASLGLSNLAVRVPSTTTALFGAIPGSAGSNDFESQYNLTILDNAIEILGGGRAELGAQMVAVSSAAENAAIDETNTQVAESGIRDVAISSATVDLARDKIVVQVQSGTLQKVLEQAKAVGSAISESIARFGH